MNIALVLAGGKGTRLSDETPKQYIEVEGKPIISYCLDTFVTHSNIDFIQIVAEDSWHDYIYSYMYEVGYKDKWKGFSKPGSNRQLSILNALKDIRSYATDHDLVLIHDAARPLLTENMIEQIFSEVKDHDGVIPVLPMKDTVYLSQDTKRITELLDRGQIYAGQAPELFRLGRYYDANIVLLPERILEINGSTEPAIIAGLDIVMVAGDEGNYKITTQEDLKRFRQQIRGV